LLTRACSPPFRVGLWNKRKGDGRGRNAYRPMSQIFWVCFLDGHVLRCYEPLRSSESLYSKVAG
jgi:hypothetical protein